MTRPPATGNPRLFAHRGTARLAPENTLAAFDFALQHGSHVLETDVRLSRDGDVMVIHDATLGRTTNGSGRVREFSVPQLKQFDASYRFTDLKGNRYQGNKLDLLTLNELFEQYPGVGINIDIKDNDIEAATAVANITQRYANSCWLNVGSFHANVIQHFRQCAPDISTAATHQEVARLILGRKPTAPLAYQQVHIPTSYWGIQLGGKSFISKVQNAGAEIVYWTINDAKRMQRLLDNGANGIVTDRADIAQHLFNQ